MVTTPAAPPAFELRTLDPARAARAEVVREILRDGTVVEGSRRPFPGVGANAPDVVDVVHARGRLMAVVKPPAELGAQEAFVADLARRLGIGEHYAQTVVRDDGTALIEVVDGDTWRNTGIRNVRDLDGAWRHAWDAHAPELPAGERATRARVNRELVQYVDWLTAQGDRSPNNGMFDDRVTAVRMIDHGRIGSETPWNRMRPWLPYAYFSDEASGVVRSVELADETRSVIASRLGPDDIRAAHQILRGASREGMPLGQDLLLRYLGSDRFLDRMLARRAGAIGSGQMQYVGGGVRTGLLNAVHGVNRLLGRYHP